MEKSRTIFTFPNESSGHHCVSTRNRSSVSDTPDSMMRVSQLVSLRQDNCGLNQELGSFLVELSLYVVPHMSLNSSSSSGPMLAVFFQSIPPISLVATSWIAPAMSLTIDVYG